MSGRSSKGDGFKQSAGREKPERPWWQKKQAWLWLSPLIVYGTYKLFYPTYHWHEKITVTVATPEGERSGHAVRSIRVVRTPQILPQVTGAEITVEGEAVRVDLEEGRYVFALLGAPVGWLRSVYETQFPDRPGGNSQIGKWESSLWGKGALPVPQKAYPLLVTFDDINDPASVKQVDPDDLDAAFGCSTASQPTPWRQSGMLWKEWRKNRSTPPRDHSQSCYVLKSVTLEITGEPVTEGRVEEALGWLGEYKNKTLDGYRFHTIKAEDQFANSLTAGSFSTEIKR